MNTAAGKKNTKFSQCPISYLGARALLSGMMWRALIGSDRSDVPRARSAIGVDSPELSCFTSWCAANFKLCGLENGRVASAALAPVRLDFHFRVLIGRVVLSYKIDRLYGVLYFFTRNIQASFSRNGHGS